MPFGIPDTRQFPWDQPLSYNLQQLTNKVTGGINTWAVNPTVGVDGQPLGAGHVGYTGVNTTTNTLVRWDGTTWVMVTDSPKLVTAPKLSLYVSQNTGSDTNDGLAASTAWKTVSKLYQELMRYNFLEKQVDIYLGPGTYALRFPPTMSTFPIMVYGASSTSVTIQRLDVAYGQNVTIQGATVGLSGIADSVYFYFPIIVSNSSTINIGSDVVFGPLGNFVAGRNMTYIVVTGGSTVNFYASSPVTVVGSANAFCGAASGSSIIMNTYGGGPTTTVMTAPPVSNGAVYNDLYSALSSADSLTTINCTGNLSVESFFSLSGGSRLIPGRAVVTGTVVGKPYNLTDASYINTSVIRGTPATGVGSIGFPNSMSSGTKDTTSTVYGTTF